MIRSNTMTANGTTTPTAILSCLLRSLETGIERDDDERLEVVGANNKDEESSDSKEDKEEGDDRERSAGEVTEDPEGPGETFSD